VKALIRGAAIRTLIRSERFVRFVTRARLTGVDADLDPQIAAILEFQRRAKLPTLESFEPVKARAYAEQQMGVAELPPEPMAHVTDTFVSFDRIPVRIFVPRGASNNWLVWIHGGGGVIGSVDGSEMHARYLAAHTKCTVASVGYRLGPEDKHPAGIDDACAAFQALAERVPAGGKIVVGGDSWGGFASVHVEHHARVTGGRRPDLQLLVYPAIDWTMSMPSHTRNADGYLLTKLMMHWFRAHYLDRDDDEGRKAVSPWFWDDAEVKDAAPAIVATAAYDPLVDEGDAWASRLRAAGVLVRHHRFSGLVHGFLSLAGIVRSARTAFDDLCQDVVEMLA
jgi:acetyl esterase